jgi:DMSO reductase family type II enzyme chaperone
VSDAGPRLEGLATREEITAALRSRAHLLLGALLSYPDAEQCAAIRSGALPRALRETLEAIDPALVGRADWAALGDAGDGDELAVEYTRLFDVGTSGPPCPLYGGLYDGARMKTMEEAVRFYNHFGLHMAESEAVRELPDHLSTELEFLHFLAFREAEACQRGEDAGPYRRAQRDFVARHPGRWVPKLRERLEAQQALPFFCAAVDLLAAFLAAEGERLAREAAGAPTDAG